ncbi:hypothetical protein PoB_005386300 [Plakobranchus ocellatus]|uniref:Uncharacterized protein n=1 Tax=Plakobranchus ocellatus TaxID=259542 RepID=A0AAV4C8M8_9GAST|nr:hypothetical protein PoB_005386300 [Plakobranchus ocellatus]
MESVKKHSTLLFLVLVISISVTECQNVAPVLTVGMGSLATISEDSPVSTSVYKCSAIDTNAGNTDDGTLRFYIDPNTINSEIEFLVFPVINSIEVNTTTGEATLKRTIDYETDGPR